MTLAPLVANDDADLANWQAGQQNTFLDMACAEVRKFCGWHIAPSIPTTGKRIALGGRGFVTLPSMYVSAVTEVVVDQHTLTADADYWWDAPKPYLRLRSNYFPRHPFALVDYTSGFEDTPLDVKAVIFELLATATELPASNANVVMTMEYRFDIRSSVGLTLSADQMQRLGRYRVTKFGAPQP